MCLINRRRAMHGEHPLRPNRRLRRAAQAHSASMASEDYFEHVGPRGQTPLRGCAPSATSPARGSGTKSARTSPGARCGSRARARSSPPGWPRPDTARHPRSPLPGNRDRRLRPSPVRARPRSAGGDLHAGLRRDHRRVGAGRRPALTGCPAPRAPPCVHTGPLPRPRARPSTPVLRSAHRRAPPPARRRIVSRANNRRRPNRRSGNRWEYSMARRRSSPVRRAGSGARRPSCSVRRARRC